MMSAIRIKSIFIALIALILESSILWLFFNHWISSYFTFFLHLLILFSLSFFIYRSYQKKQDLNYPCLLFLSVLGAGPLGLLGFLLMTIFTPLYTKLSPSSKVWLKDLFPEFNPSAFTQIYQRIKSGWNDYDQLHEIISFQDLFTYGTLAQKQTVLDTIVKDFDPIYSPILKRALNDPQNTVRIQAAAIVTKIDLDFSEKLKTYLEEYQGKHDIQAILKLADLYDAYASSGVVTAFREKELREKAIYYYKEYLKSYPNDRNTWLSVGRLLFHNQDYQEFIIWFHAYQKHLGKAPQIVFTWYQESLYRLQKFEELSDVSKGLEP